MYFVMIATDVAERIAGSKIRLEKLLHRHPEEHEGIIARLHTDIFLFTAFDDKTVEGRRRVYILYCHSAETETLSPDEQRKRHANDVAKIDALLKAVVFKGRRGFVRP